MDYLRNMARLGGPALHGLSIVSMVLNFCFSCFECFMLLVLQSDGMFSLCMHVSKKLVLTFWNNKRIQHIRIVRPSAGEDWLGPHPETAASQAIISSSSVQGHVTIWRPNFKIEKVEFASSHQAPTNAVSRVVKILHL